MKIRIKGKTFPTMGTVPF